MAPVGALALRLDETELPVRRDEALPAPIDMAYKRRLVRQMDPERAWVEATEGERELARQKQRFVAEVQANVQRGWTTERAVSAAAMHPEWFPAVIADRAKLSVHNFRHWRKQLKAGKGKPRALLRHYRQGVARRQLATEWFPEFAQGLCSQFFHANGLDLSVSYTNACRLARGAGLTDADIPSQAQAERYLRKVAGERLQIWRRDPEKYREELSGYFMLEWDCEPGTVWIGDHRVLDIFVRHPVMAEDGTVKEWIPMRPWCTAWMDAKSGFLVAITIYCSQYPNHAKILETLYLGIRSNGGVPPLCLITDNGKDYLKKGALRDVMLQTMGEPTRGKNGRKTLVEEAFEEVVATDGEEYRHSVARSLGCTHRTTAPYKGRQKPIERIFRNFARAFDKLFYGYAGNRPATRPEEIRDFRGNTMRLLTEGELRTHFREWLGEGYHDHPTKSRRTGGLTPRECWEQRRQWREPMGESELQLAMLLPHDTPLEVRAGPGGSSIYFRDWPYEGATVDDHVTLGDYHGRALLVKTSWSPSEPDISYGAKSLPARIWLFELDGRGPVLEAIPAMTRDVFGKSDAQAKRIGETCHKVAALRKADREAREALAGTARIFAPAQQMGMQTKTGPVDPQALPDSAGPVHKSMTPGNLRGRLAAPGGRDAGEPPPPRARQADPATVDRFADFLTRRGQAATDTSGLSPDTDLAARMDRYTQEPKEA